MISLRRLFIENPMLVEVKRYRRKLLGGSRPTGANIAFLTLFAVCYMGLLLIVGNGNGSIPPIFVVLIQTSLFTLAAPALLNSAIAGEREKRTWDLLMVAPVTKAQVMIGKMAGAAMNLLIGAALFLLPIFICAVSYSRTDYGKLAVAELNSLAFGILTCAISLFFSARCKRPFTALAMSLGFLLTGLVIYPILLASLGITDTPTLELLLIFHPFMAQAGLSGEISDFGGNAPLVQVFAFLCFAVITLVWTERTLTFSDNEVRFINTKSHA
jgi:ABC-type transport system involved in multi-copper enzyme maturation permease subunit